MFRFEGMTFQPENGALRKGSETVVLRAKTAQVLHLLLQSPDRLVTKDQLLDEVWSDCHVGPGSLVQSIQELRRVLGDNAKNPRFIQTLPRRGYQWIAPLNIVPGNLSEKQLPDGKDAQSESMSSTTKPKIRWHWVSPVGFLLLGMVASAIWHWRKQAAPELPQIAPATGDPVRVLMLPIVEDTDDPVGEWMGAGIRDMVADHLANIPSVTLLSTMTAFEALSEKKIAMPLGEAEAEALMKATNASLLVQSRILPKGDRWTFEYLVFRQAAPVEQGKLEFSDPLELSRRVAGLLDTSPQAIGPSNNFSNVEEANRDFLRGKRALETQSAPLAKRYFEAALLQDPHFEACRLQLARAHYLMGEMREAEALYARVLDTSNQLGRDGQQVQALEGLAAVDWRTGRLQRSVSRLSNALEQSRQIYRRDLEARCLRQLGWHYNHLGYWKKHDDLERRAQALFEAMSDEERVADELYYLGSSESPAQDFRRNRLLLQMALNYYRKTNNPYDLAYTNLAMAFNRETPNAEKIACLQKAETLFEKLGYRLVLPAVWEGLGLARAQSLDYQGFKNNLLKANRVYTELGTRGDRANTEFLLGAAEIMIGLSESGEASTQAFDRGLAWLDRCSPFNVEHKVIGRQASTALLRGLVALEKAQFEQASNHFQTGLGLFQELDLPEGIAVSAIAIATRHLESNQWQEALTWLQMAEESYPDRPGLWQPYAIYAHLKMGEVDRAWQLAQDQVATARVPAMAEAQRWLNLCETIRSGVSRELPPPPNLLDVYFQSF